MVLKKSLEEIRRILGNVGKPEEAFWCCNGTIATNIYELMDAIEDMREIDFVYHVNLQKNDFARWIRDVLRYDELADALEGVLEREEYLKILQEMILRLEGSAVPRA